MCTEGLNLNSAVMPQAGQVTDSAIFMVSICASASWRHWRQFTMSSPSALPMNAKVSESKRGIIIRPCLQFCILYHTNRGLAHHDQAGMRALELTQRQRDIEEQLSRMETFSSSKRRWSTAASAPPSSTRFSCGLGPPHACEQMSLRFRPRLLPRG